MKTYLRLYFDSVWGSVGSGAVSGATTGLVAGPWGAAVGGLVGAGLGLFEGEQQKKQSAKLLAANQFTPATVPQSALYNQQLAEQQANEGLPSQQYQMAMKNIQRQQSTAMRSAQDRRAGVGLIGQIQQGSNDSQARLDAQNAQVRLQNQQRLMGVNNQVAGYTTQAWQLNEQNRRQQYNYGMQLLGAGNENIIHGIDSGVASLMRSGGGLFGTNNTSNNGITGMDRYSNPNLSTIAPNQSSLGTINPSGNALNLTYNQ